MLNGLEIILSVSNLQLISCKGKMMFLRRFGSTTSTLLKLKTAVFSLQMVMNNTLLELFQLNWATAYVDLVKPLKFNLLWQEPLQQNEKLFLIVRTSFV